MPETRMDSGSWAFSMLFKLGMMFGWQIQPSESGGCGMHMRSVAFVRYIRCAVSLVIRRRVSSLLCVVQKKRLRGLWPCTHGLVRPQYAPGSRSVQRRQPYLSRVRSATRAVQELWPSEARASWAAMCCHRVSRTARWPPAHLSPQGGLSAWLRRGRVGWCALDREVHHCARSGGASAYRAHPSHLCPRAYCVCADRPEGTDALRIPALRSWWWPTPGVRSALWHNSRDTPVRTYWFLGLAIVV